MEGETETVDLKLVCGGPDRQMSDTHARLPFSDPHGNESCFWPG